MLIPDAAVLPDQTEHVVLTVDSNGVVVAKRVELGDLRDGLRVVRAGLAPSDKVIIDGIPMALPGATVSPRPASIRGASTEHPG